jgi:hypothetical protein
MTLLSGRENPRRWRCVLFRVTFAALKIIQDGK